MIVFQLLYYLLKRLVRSFNTWMKIQYPKQIFLLHVINYAYKLHFV